MHLGVVASSWLRSLALKLVSYDSRIRYRVFNKVCEEKQRAPVEFLLIT